MIYEKQITSIFRSPYQLYFKNGAPNPAGDLLAAGVGYPTKRNNWEDTRELWAYPYYSLNIMLGDGRASYRNENGFRSELSYGHFFLNFPNIKKHYAPVLGENWGEFYVAFAGTIFDVIREQKIITPKQPVWHLSKPEPWIKRLQTFVEKPVPSSPQDKLRRAIYFQGYLLQMLEKGKPVHASQVKVDWFDHACGLLTKDLHHDVDLLAIADELNMSYHTFRIYFRRRAEMPPLLYREQARIKAACDYLSTNPIKKCKEIAFDLGYSSEEQFSKQFKKHIGMAPSEYRKRHCKD